jgi:hypothetical protein
MDTLTCSRCGTAKPVNQFPFARGGINGSRCNACLAELRRAERAAKKAAQPPKTARLTERDRTTKRCNSCGIEKPVSEFYWNVRRWSSVCRSCISVTGKAFRLNTPPSLPSPDYFWSKVDRLGPDECWPWIGNPVTIWGYGALNFRGHHTQAHRVAYQLAIGPIPEGLHIDHTCHTKDCRPAKATDCPHRRCCNPRHLEAVTPLENNRRRNLDDRK